MGTILKRLGSYRVVIRRASMTKPKTRTFPKKGMAEQWMREEETRLDARELSGDQQLGPIIERYISKVLDKRPYETKAARSHLERAARWFADTYVGDCDANWWIEFAQRLTVQPQSRKKYLTEVAGVLRAAEEMGWCGVVRWVEYRKAMATLKRLKLVGKKKHRERRLSDDELAQLKEAWPLIRTKIPMPDLIEFAIELALRESEICALRWSDLQGPEAAKMVLVRDRKHNKEKVGNDWLIPLIGRSYELIKLQRARAQALGIESDLIFPYKPQTLGYLFRKMARQAGIADLRFHDLRHEGISRLFELAYSIPEVSLISGHRDWASLKIYAQIKPKDLHKGPVARRAIPPELLKQHSA